MKIGFIGAGPIGGFLARLDVAIVAKRNMD
jgi:hypothetical protein